MVNLLRPGVVKATDFPSITIICLTYAWNMGTIKA